MQWTALGAVALLACNDQPTAPLPDQLVVTRPPALVGAPGFPMMDTLFVRVLDATGNPRAGVPVTWGVRDGGGSVRPLTEISGTDGTTAAIWTLGPKPGYNELRVSISEESSYTFTATGEVFRATEVVSDGWIGCGLVDGAIWCWGNGAPVRGTPASDYNAPTVRRPFDYTNSGPALYDDSREYTDLALGHHSRVCALDTQGAVWCNASDWGLRDKPPVLVAGFPTIRRGSLVGSLFRAICGIAESDGRAWCLTDDGLGMVPDSPSFTMLRLNWQGSLSCGLLADSTAVCWGAVLTTSPLPVGGGHRFVDLAVGYGYACGRDVQGALWCWNGRSSDTELVEPTLKATNVTLVGAMDWELLLAQGPVSLTMAANAFSPWERSVRPIEGLEGNPIAALPEGGSGCVLGVGDEVYCVREHWDYSSAFEYYSYFPVMPVRQPPPAPAVLR